MRGADGFFFWNCCHNPLWSCATLKAFLDDYGRRLFVVSSPAQNGGLRGGSTVAWGARAQLGSSCIIEQDTEMNRLTGLMAGWTFGSDG